MADDRDVIFRQVRAAELERLKGLEKSAASDVRSILSLTQQRIESLLKGQPTDYQRWSMTALDASIGRSLAAMGDELGAKAVQAAETAWSAGVNLVDNPIAASGIGISSVLGEVDPRQLFAMRSFLIRKMTDVPVKLQRKIKTELGLVITGARSPFQAIDKIGGLMDGGFGKARALTIVRTEVGRAYSVATQERQEKAKAHLPGLKKQWRRSGKINSRLTHDVADGQIREVEEAFDVGGHKLMHPRDSAGPAKETINCGCSSLPYMDDWEVSNPGAIEITTDEFNRNANKRLVAEVQRESYRRWAKAIQKGVTGPGKAAKVTGSWHGVARISPQISQALDLRGLDLASTEIAITDRQVAHALRRTKQKAGKALSAQDMIALPDHLANPKAIIRDQLAKQPTLIYVFEVEGEERLGTAVVRLRELKKSERPRRHNRVVTTGLQKESDLKNTGRYEELFWK